MDTAWIAPPALLLGAAGLIGFLLRRLLGAVEDLGGSQQNTRRVQGALIPVRVETRRVAEARERLRHQ